MARQAKEEGMELAGRPKGRNPKRWSNLGQIFSA